MPAKSYAQLRYIMALRGKYKSRENTPEDKKWIWDEGWQHLEKGAKKN